MHAACDLNCIVRGEGLPKVMGSHVHWKSGNGGRDVVTGYLIGAIVMTLSVILLLQTFSSAIFRIYGELRRPSAHAELLVIVCIVGLYT